MEQSQLGKNSRENLMPSEISKRRHAISLMLIIHLKEDGPEDDPHDPRAG
jgi:hypothetical protein